ncbi:MAG: hypothetical protein J0L93_01480 [Deltaproteobacteria bacterium]|nr:hypothetical protein [Deltaproteobacteria bacterium]
MNKSKKLSPENYIFYLDECLGGKKVYEILKNAGLNVESYDSHFPRGTADEDWLPVIGQRGWILLTQDDKIRRRKNERNALRRNRVCAFIVTAGGLRGEEIGKLIVGTLPKIFRILKNTKPPLIATINRHTVVELKEGARRY